MVRVLLDGYCVGKGSSRDLERAWTIVVAFRSLCLSVCLSAQQSPDFRSFSRFRKRHLAVSGNVFLQALELCRAAGIFSLGQVALDGTKVRASASRRKSMSDVRLSEKQKVLAQELPNLLPDAEQIDAGEDARFGDQRGAQFTWAHIRVDREHQHGTLGNVALVNARGGEYQPESILDNAGDSTGVYSARDDPHGLGSYRILAIGRHDLAPLCLAHDFKRDADDIAVAKTAHRILHNLSEIIANNDLGQPLKTEHRKRHRGSLDKRTPTSVSNCLVCFGQVLLRFHRATCKLSL